MNHRRAFLLGALGLAGGRAWALSAETVDVPTARLMASTCHDRSAHPRLLAELAEKLGEITPEQRERIVAAATCPFCGCRLSQAD